MDSNALSTSPDDLRYFERLEERILPIATNYSPECNATLDVTQAIANCSQLAITTLWNGSVTSSSVSDAIVASCTERSLLSMLCLSVVLGSIVIVTIGGNLLVCVTIRTNRRLQNPTNCFVFSLATTDLLLGATVLPFSALTTVQSAWPFGAIFCNIYVSSDVMLCTVSILTLFAISLDRFFAVQTPLRYEQHISMRLAIKLSAVIWLFSLVMAFVPIHLGWNTPSLRVQNMASPEVCMFELNKVYALLVALSTYVAPFAVMCAVYVVIWQTTRRQVRAINSLKVVSKNVSQYTLGQSSSQHTLQQTASSHMLTVPSASQNTLHQMKMVNQVNQIDDDFVNGSREHYDSESMSPTNMSAPTTSRLNSVESSGQLSSSMRACLKACEKADRRLMELDTKRIGKTKTKSTKCLKDTKATVTLASVVICFAICWVPYFTLFTIKPFLEKSVSCDLELFVLWLGYVNSAVNPFLYAFYNSNFRAGFYRVLCPRRYRQSVRRSLEDDMSQLSWRHNVSNVDADFANAAKATNATFQI